MQKRIETLFIAMLGALLGILVYNFAAPLDAAYIPIPSGTIAYYNRSRATGCPLGWTEFTNAQGAYIVGLNATTSTLNTLVGTRLSDQESRPVGLHNHTITDVSHTHTIKKDQAPAGASPNAVVTTQNFSAGNFFTSETSFTGITGTLNSSGTGATAGTPAPYIQLLVCSKS